MRPLTYANASVFLVCFSVASRVSFENVQEKWVPELTRHASGKPCILVGTQADIGGGGGGKDGAGSKLKRRVEAKEGVKLAKAIGAIRYMECSAKTGAGVKELFAEAVLAGIDPEKAKAKAAKESHSSCSLQ